MFDIFQDFTLKTVALGASLLGLTSGALGSFALLRKQSLLGDTISHAALPGIVLAFMLSGSKNSLILLLGAALAGWLGALLILLIIKNTRITSDGAQGVILSVFFGVGLLLLTFVQSQPNAAQAGLDKYLFGQAAALLPRDIQFIGIISFISLFCLLFLWKEIKLITFDPLYGETLGFSSSIINVIITLLIVITIVSGLQTVGVILMSSMLIAPAAAARQWTNRLGLMVILSAFFGLLSGVVGALLSSLISNLPTGPTIVLCLSTVFLISLLFAPNRGIIFQMIRRFNRRYNVSRQKILLDLYYLEEKHHGEIRGHDIKTISLIRKRGGNVKMALQFMKSQNLVKEQRGLWQLSSQGRIKAQNILEGGLYDF